MTHLLISHSFLYNYKKRLPVAQAPPIPMPITDTSASGDWRNSDIRNIIKEHKLEYVKIVPFYNVSLPLWSMHVNGHLRDCTHFCWSPMLYQSLFHALAEPYHV
jgi:hypothetical protein